MQNRRTRTCDAKSRGSDRPFPAHVTETVPTVGLVLLCCADYVIVKRVHADWLTSFALGGWPRSSLRTAARRAGRTRCDVCYMIMWHAETLCIHAMPASIGIRPTKCSDHRVDQSKETTIYKSACPHHSGMPRCILPTNRSRYIHMT